MTPDFALSLSSDGLTLLRRKAGGWLALAETDLSAEAFDTTRDRALSEDPAGAQVALFLPNDQVRYLEVPDPGTESARRAALEAALDGTTPYPVDALVLDWSISGTTLLGAAVARESLEEAEAFLRDHGFDPVLFAAIPPSGTFRGTAFFGPAAGWSGTAPERPGKVVLLPPEAAEEGHEAGVAETLADGASSEPASELTEQGVAADAASAQDEATAAETSSAAGTTDEPVETPDAPESSIAPESARAPADLAPEAPAADAPVPDATPPAPDVAPPAARPEPAPFPAPPAPAVSAPTELPASPSFSSVRASRAPAPAAPASAPRLSMGRETPGTARAAPVPAPETRPPETPDLRGPAEAAPVAGTKPAKRKPFGFGKRRDGQTTPGAATAVPVPPPVTTSGRPPARTPVRTPPEPETGSGTTQGIKQVTPRPPVSQPIAPSGSAPVSGQARVAALRQEAEKGDAKVRSRRGASLTPEEERERLTVFGARDGQKVGGKPRFLGLILTVLLLLFLAAVAAFSSAFLGDEISRFFASDPADEIALAAPETIDEAAPSEAADTAAPEDSTEEEADSILAALELPPAASDGFEDVPAPQPTGRSRMSNEEAAASYAVTGIWQRAPSAPDRPPQTNAEDVYVASIDPEVQQFDAVALPDLDAGPRDDLSLEPVRLPPGPGVRFDLDDRGLVKATPEGTVSPDGVRIFTGLPPQTPPLRDPAPEAQPGTPEDGNASAEEGAAASDTGAASDEVPTLDPAADPALSGFRPRGRPGDLIEQTERAVLGGVSLAELERMRPQMRPLTAQEEALALDLPVTDQAIGASLTPLPRPRSMEAIVQEAVKQASNAPAPIAPGPSIPQNANVARSATLTNQIDLREISLIGVYGKDSSRRALVRLPSGKYQKVQVGDRIDGGRIAAIDEDELRYVKSGRNVVLKMPRS
ncbi:hypothetical protein [Alloyangia pacifica]|uniref:Translation initiation factor 2 n=1 Tax=Alloyangia pacifica TaxID=311180 RepID=A0A1I6TN40_9RHOB|nr:hypothetical protein [Alloyangia pacifica]SDH12704.1 hypothetical protein SAMN04488245_106180 [Alloyangia pacifica]SFS90626.1 hypothetical protein SAMN04488050_106211 [Alloyangia pacifica]